MFLLFKKRLYLAEIVKKLKRSIFFNLEASFYCLTRKRERNLNFLKGIHGVF